MACGCEAQVKMLGGRLCPEVRCEELRAYLEEYCRCLGPYEHLRVPCVVDGKPSLCCPFSGSSPVPVYNADGTMCYCCCFCDEGSTQVAGADGFKAIEDVRVGDPVLAADAALRWSLRTVEFSGGTGTDALGTEMIEVTFSGAEGEEARLVVTPAHLFYLPDGTLKRADRLVAGEELVRADGGRAPVLRLEAGPRRGAVHHIATSATPATGVDGHLLNCNGIVTGDYALQLADIGRAADGGGLPRSG